MGEGFPRMGTKFKTTAGNGIKIFALVVSILFVYDIKYFPVSFESISSGYYSLKVSRIQATLEFLASKHFRGRRTGSPEEDLTAAYLASVFQRNGLQPAPNTGGTYIQEFELIHALPRAESHLKWKGVDQPVAELKIGEDFLPAPWGTESFEVAAEPVFVGYGIVAPELGYNDYSKISVKGKIAVTLSKTPEGSGHNRWDFYSQKDYDEPLQKALLAQSAGAAGFVVILPPNESIPSLETINYKSAKVYLNSEVSQLRIPAVFVAYRAGERLFESQPTPIKLSEIQKQLDESLRPHSISLHGNLAVAVSYERKIFRGRNVLGYVPGVDPSLKEECLIIGAHHDHLGPGESGDIFYGADDDASGTTGLLELAAAFSAGTLKPKRSILLAAWGAEELGLLGSRYYVQHPSFPLLQTITMLQMDMIGRNEERTADPVNHIEEEKPLENTNTVSIAGSLFSPDVKRIIQSCNLRVNLKLRYRYDNGQENLLKRSDQWPFLESGIPSFFFFTGFHPDYHKTTDTADKINFEKMERVLKLVYLTAWEIAESSSKPGFQLPPAKGKEL